MVDHPLAALLPILIAPGLPDPPPEGETPPPEPSIEPSPLDRLVAVGSRATWTKTEDGSFWTVYQGAGLTGYGEGKTLARAIRMIGAHYEHDPANPANKILVDINGNPIPPEE